MSTTIFFKKFKYRTFLVIQWLRIHLPIQGTWVQFLVGEDSACCGATKPNVPQVLCPHSRPCSATRQATVLKNRAPQLESSLQLPPLGKAVSSSDSLTQPKINTFLKF